MPDDVTQELLAEEHRCAAIDARDWATLSLILPVAEPSGPRLAHLQATARGISRALGSAPPRVARPAARA